MTPGKSRRLAEIRGHRGANDNHTDVVVDGNELSDTISIQYDFSNLLTVDTKCVEVVRDGHSRIYGSDTIGSVVTTIAKSGHSPPIVVFARFGGQLKTIYIGCG